MFKRFIKVLIWYGTGSQNPNLSPTNRLIWDFAERFRRDIRIEVLGSLSLKFLSNFWSHSGLDFKIQIWILQINSFDLTEQIEQGIGVRSFEVTDYETSIGFFIWLWFGLHNSNLIPSNGQNWFNLENGTQYRNIIFLKILLSSNVQSSFWFDPNWCPKVAYSFIEDALMEALNGVPKERYFRSPISKIRQIWDPTRIWTSRSKFDFFKWTNLTLPKQLNK